MRTQTSTTPATKPARAPERLEIATIDGAPLTLHEHAAVVPRGVVVVLGAMATPSRFYGALADHLASRGLTTVRFDYRGVGDSRAGSLRGNTAGVLDWTIRDVDAAMAFVHERHPSLPIAVLGHSLGGQSIGVAHRPTELAKAFVLVAAQSGWVGHWRGLARWRMELLWRVVVPSVTHTFGYLPSWTGIGEDVPARVAREWGDWCKTRGYVTGVRGKGELHYEDVHGPVLAWSFEDDDYAPSGSIDELLSWLVNARIDHRALRPSEIGAKRIGHFGFFRRAQLGLWDVTADWLLRALASTPS